MSSIGLSPPSYTPSPGAPAPAHGPAGPASGPGSLVSIAPSPFASGLVPKFDEAKLMQDLAEAHADLTKEGIKTSNQRLLEAERERKLINQKILDLMANAAKLADEAKKAASESKVAGWAEAIGGLVGAVAAWVGVGVSLAVTGGASAPLVFVAVSGSLAALQDVTNMGLKEDGVKWKSVTGESKQADVSFGGMIDAIVDQQIVDGTIVEIRKNSNGDFVDKNGLVIEDPHKTARPGTIFMTSKELAEWKMGWTITTTLVVAAATIMAGYGAAEFAHKGAIVASKAADFGKLAKFGEIGAEGVGIVADTFQAVASIVQGTITLKLSEIDADTDEARAWKAFYESSVKELTQRLSIIMELIKQLVKNMNEIHEGASDAIKGTSESTANTAHNTV